MEEKVGADDSAPGANGAITNAEQSSSRHAPTYIVGVGASAGGLEALEKLFANMPRYTGLAFVVVQHLSPDFKSLMNELLARRTEIPIDLVEDGMAVEADRIYLIPPKKEMIIAGGRLLLSDKGSSQDLSLPIDIFLRSLAQDAQEKAIGVILSGSGSDGSRGIRDIHESGGLVLCQDAETAKFDGMPKSARDTGAVDYVMPPEDMPRALLDHIQHPFGQNLADSLTAHPARTKGLSAIYRLLQEEFGLDFSHYKPNTVTRRIERRLQLNRATDLHEYAERIAENRDELDALYRDLLIGVTRFFRDESMFQLLESQVIPDLMRRAAGNEEFRVWVAGCATGEEAYSLAILLHEQSLRLGQRPRIKMFATDVHRGSLEFASHGLYEATALAGLSEERLNRCFVKEGSNYRVRPELRQYVVFAPHNVVKDAPFTKVDLISCRNLLIYLQPLAQKKVLSMFHFALRRGGVMVMGPSESPGVLADDFEGVDPHWRIYRKQRDLRLSTDVRLTNRAVGEPRHAAMAAPSSANKYSLSQIMNTYDALLEQFMPPSLLINERREVIHAFGGAGKYLRVKDGRPSLDLLDMVGSNLKMALTGALQRALRDDVLVVYNGLRLDTPDGEKTVRLSVRPVRSKSSSSPELLISFEAEEQRPLPVVSEETQVDVGQLSRDQLNALESELRYTKENLQATIEELETSNEELQATNEELTASNEELQSTNEELQSVNEELYTVNAEYQKKIAQLTELTNDMDNLLASTEVGTMFLDRELCIRRFTPKLAESFNLLPQDLGRPIDAFTSNLDHLTLQEDLVAVLASAQPIEREVRDRHGRWFLMRIMPYRGRSPVEGVVLTLIETTSVKTAQDALFQERHLLDSLMETVPDAIYFKDAKSRYIRINHAMADRLGISDPNLAAGKRARDFSSFEQVKNAEMEDEHVLRTGVGQEYKEERSHLRDGREGWCLTTRLLLRDRDGGVVGTFGVSRDITDRKRADDKIREGIKRRDQFLAMLSHELRNPLGAIVNAMTLLEWGKNGNASSGNASSKALGVIDRQTRHMARLLDDLLEVSRVTQNKIELRRSVIDLRTVAEDALRATQADFERHGLTLTTDVETTPLCVDADAARIQQICLNLLNNSAKYTPAGGKVAISLRREGEQAVFRVCDDGVGIAPEMLEGIFELFVQSDKTLDRAEGGMGVGLTLVRSLVEMHGGSVEARSDGPGCGSEFVVRLPLVGRDVEPVVRSDLARKPWPRGGRVVIVEDNPDSRETLQHLLELGGYRVITASSGREGVACIKRERPEIAIIDIGLPGMSGYDVARELRADGAAKSYLVALTGYGQPSDRFAALAAGFDEHLVKPLQPEQLERLLDTADEAKPAPAAEPSLA
jgi:two-component system, chemotaxis family, CheB/CheR fusion protein